MDSKLIKIIETEKKFATAVYKNFNSIRFGMTPCCILDMEKEVIKKELSDWQKLNSDVALSDVYSSMLGVEVCLTPTETGTTTWTAIDVQALIDRLQILEETVANAVDEKDLNYIHTQSTALAVWTIIHDLGKKPSVRIEDLAGNDIVAEIDYIDLNTLKIIFAIPLSGTAYLN
jgi:hypothetical protein